MQLILLPTGSYLIQGIDDTTAQLFQRLRHPCCALIASNTSHYWSPNGAWAEFDPSEMDRPKGFVSMRACQKRCDVLNAEGWNKRWEPMIWIHSEYYYQFIDRYQQMTGNHFPGSPRH